MVKVLAIGGSIRAVRNDTSNRLIDIVNSSIDLDNYIAQVKKINFLDTKSSYFTNTEILSGAALLGAKEHAAEINFFPLIKLFPRNEKAIHDWETELAGFNSEVLYFDPLDISPKFRDELISECNQADAIILVSPVYFGDRSSVSNKIMQIALSTGIFNKKIVSTISVGAKRNGGQETTNIFQLSEVREMGAYIIGNGPKSSQYGGTGLGGDLGTVIDDNFGFETSYGTGKRIAQASALFKSEPCNDSKSSPRISVLVTMDTNTRILFNTIYDIVKNIHDNVVDLDIIQLIDGDIERCIACNICPIPELLESSDSYACIIQSKTDSMKSLREKLLLSDGIIIAGLNLLDMDNVIYRYQAFTERTRFIRRNNFELTNKLLTSFTLEEAGATANLNFTLKVMTSYMRHNSIICTPIRQINHEQKMLIDPAYRFTEFCNMVREFHARRINAPRFSTSYKAGGSGGYNDERLDHTQAMR